MRKSHLLMPLSGLLAVLILATGDAMSAEVDYPHDTVTLVTHSSPGGGTDVFLREMIKHLGPIMGVDFVVENASGGSGAKAMALLATSPPDGTIFYGTTPTFINTSILSDVEYTYETVDGRARGKKTARSRPQVPSTTAVLSAMPLSALPSSRGCQDHRAANQDARQTAQSDQVQDRRS
jgi:hypothetical protein